jgi:hypothetical protein
MKFVGIVLHAAPAACQLYDGTRFTRGGREIPYHEFDRNRSDTEYIPCLICSCSTSLSLVIHV